MQITYSVRIHSMWGASSYDRSGKHTTASFMPPKSAVQSCMQVRSSRYCLEAVRVDYRQGGVVKMARYAAQSLRLLETWK